MSRVGWGRAQAAEGGISARFGIGMLALAVGGVVSALACTRHGAGIGGDGVAYVMTARNLLDGYGLSWIGPTGDIRPLTVFAPLFPTLLGAGGLLGVDPLLGARWLNAGLFGLNVFLTVAILRVCVQDAGLPLVGGMFVLFSPVFFPLHTGVASEPVFMTLLLLATLGLVQYLCSGEVRWLLLAACGAGASYLARYAGTSLIAAGALLVLFRREERWRARVRRSLLFLVVACVPVALWMARNAIVAGTSTSRVLEYQPIEASLFGLIADLVSYWFLPDRVPPALRAAMVLVGALFLLIAGIWAQRRSPEAVVVPEERCGWALTGVWGVTSGVYLGVLLVSRAFLVPRISLDQRILSPVHLLTLLALIVAVDRIRGSSSRWLGWLATGGVLLLAVFYIGRGTVRALELQVDGQGFASLAWRSSPLINAMELLPAETPIYTNEVEAVYLLSSRRPYRLPTGCLPVDALYGYEPGGDCRTAEYLTWASNMRESLAQEGAVLAIFDTYAMTPYYAAVVPELVEGLDVLTTQGDGRLYVLDRGQWPESPHW